MIARGSDDSGYTPETFEEIKNLEEQVGQHWLDFLELVGSGEYEITEYPASHNKWWVGAVSLPFVGTIDRAYLTERTANDSHQTGIYDLDRLQGFMRVDEYGEEYYVAFESDRIRTWGAWVIGDYLSAQTASDEKELAAALCRPILKDFPLREVTAAERDTIYQKLPLSQLTKEDFVAIVECYYQAAYARQGEVRDPDYIRRRINGRLQENYQVLMAGEHLALRFGSKHFSSTKLELSPDRSSDLLTTYLYLNNDIGIGSARVSLPEDIEMAKLFGQLVAEHFAVRP